MVSLMDVLEDFNFELYDSEKKREEMEERIKRKHLLREFWRRDPKFIKGMISSRPRLYKAMVGFGANIFFDADAIFMKEVMIYRPRIYTGSDLVQRCFMKSVNIISSSTGRLKRHKRNVPWALCIKGPRGARGFPLGIGKSRG